jgi:biopolymer transport protein ExbB/TolQ
MVAIPAVVAYNILQGRVRRTLGRVDAMAHLILARSQEEAGTAGSSSKGA